MGSPKVVALGGGHGLHASLSAMRHVVEDLTAIVTVADDGGSSGRLRSEFGVLPPGDLRMALAALCGDDEWGQTWARLMQHRFQGSGEMRGHSLGNLLIVGLWELLGNHVTALEWVSRLLGAQGRVLPVATTPMDITATVRGADPRLPDEITKVRGQVAVARAPGVLLGIELEPPDAPACAEAVEAVREADWVVLGPGSWFSSVLPHLVLPELREAVCGGGRRVIVVLNLAEQKGETLGYLPEDLLAVLLNHAPELPVHTVLADHRAVPDPELLEQVVRGMGAQLVLADIAEDDGSPRHDHEKLAAAYARILGDV
ncbi:uridine diphosphate-N-acetylglucosamine-binding protein YvcK [Nocardioides sp. AE5]|uniref:gluconeogenesis factor YvcK family protein n=1 Tax=Nocardioides sp. AE5 TaxID=2962573 RepID=UPI00288252C1|nr:uridine diphosphate-N-acetylglucosamine-binding protein YvcK [Nocardioides sp. AE5]MDT0203647.1 uridine diphosphate-N-acetylglucosamine-binding protein YvcK [Nocardioides sp. AE5]